MTFFAISMSDLATRNRSFFPPERMRSTALQRAARRDERWFPGGPATGQQPPEPAGSRAVC